MILPCRAFYLAGCLFAFFASVVTMPADAAIIAYTFDGDLLPTVDASGITGYAVTGGAGAPGLNSGDWGYVTDPVLRVTNIDVTTASSAIANDMYFDFGLNMGSADPDLLYGGVLSFDVARGGSTTPRGFALACSLDGYANLLIASDVPTARTTFTNYSFLLDTSLFQGVTGDVFFRMYVYAPNTGASLEFDNIQIAAAESGMWRGGGGDNNWSTVANWVGELAPTSSNTANITLGNTDSTVSVQDLTDPFLLNRLNIVGVGDGISLSGNALQFEANGSLLPLVDSSRNASNTIANDIEFADTLTVQVNAGSLALTGDIAGAGQTLDKRGAGTLMLSGQASLEEILLSTGTLAIDNTATLDVTGEIDFRSSGGAITLCSSDANTLTVGGSATPILINLSSDVTLGTDGTGDLVFYGELRGGGGAKVMTINNDTTTFYGSVTGNTNPITKAGSGTLVLVNSSISKPLQIEDGTIQIGDGGTTGTLGTVDIENNGALVVNRSGDIVISQAISGTGSLTRMGTGMLVLSGANTYSGTTTVTDGLLRLSNSLALQNSTLTVNEVEFDSTVAGNAFTLGGLSGSGDLVLENNNPTPDAIALTVGNNSENTEFGGNLSGAGSLTKIGTGTLLLSGTNTYTGGTTVSSGALSIAATDALPGWDQVGAYSVAEGAILAVGNAVSGTQFFAIRDMEENIADGAFVGFDTTAGDRTFSSAIDGDLGVAKVGANILRLTATNTYTGGTIIKAGTLRIVDDGALGAAPTSFDADNIVLDGGVLKNNGGSVTLHANRGVTLGAANGTFEVRGDTEFVVPGAISGEGDLRKMDGGTLVLDGDNTYTGTTSVNTGTLLVNGTHTGAGAYTVHNGTTLGGTGSIGGATTINDGGFLAPGASIGTLTFTDDVTLETDASFVWEFTATGTAGVDYDTISGTSLILPESGTVNLSIMGLDGYTLAAGDRFTLFEGDVYQGSTLLEAGADITDLFTINDNVGWWGSWEVTAGSLVLTAVPEPGAFALLSSILALLACRRRRNV